MVWPFTGKSLSERLGAKAEAVQAKVKDQMATQLALQREIQMSVQIAQARDMLQWYGGLYSVAVTAITVGLATGKPVPPVAAIPVVMGGFALTNMADLAYGNKMVRVVREAQNILEHERPRLVPPKQAIFYDKYSEEEKAAYPNTHPVSTYWPSMLPWHFEEPALEVPK